MAATVAVSRSQMQAVSFGAFRARLVKVTPGSADYPTGGYAISPNSLGMAEVLGAIVVGLDATAKTVQVQWIYNVQTGKLQAFGTAGSATGLTEIANNTDLSASPVHVLVLGV